MALQCLVMWHLYDRLYEIMALSYLLFITNICTSRKITVLPEHVFLAWCELLTFPWRSRWRSLLGCSPQRESNFQELSKLRWQCLNQVRLSMKCFRWSLLWFQLQNTSIKKWHNGDSVHLAFNAVILLSYKDCIFHSGGSEMTLREMQIKNFTCWDRTENS